ncbi:MAG: ExbD/TolR family protein [Phycisphaeraceae bacterium]
MSQVTKRGAVEPNLNITPLIDVVFLLIVFFMLVNNIVTDEVPELKLPDLEDPNTSTPEGDRRVIVNIVPEAEFTGDPGPGTPPGEVLSRPGQAEFVTIGNKKWQLGDDGAMEDFRAFFAKTVQSRMVNPTTAPNIMLRVDAAVYYAQVLPVMTNLQLAMAEALGGELAASTPVHLVAYVGED